MIEGLVIFVLEGEEDEDDDELEEEIELVEELEFWGIPLYCWELFA